VREDVGAADAPADLVELGEPEQVGALDDQRVRLRDVQPRLDDRGRDENVRVAAVGFELYVELLAEAVAELSGQRRPAARPIRVDAKVDAYVPAAYIPAEALKIDLHRRISLSETEDELVELRAATEDRYGPIPEPVENLFSIQEAKLKLARIGADYLVFRNGRATVGPLVLGSQELGDLRRRVDTAVYTTSKREVSLRQEGGENGGGFASALSLVTAILESRQAA
jgi:transcription-repair coupling factor (superfamily II helicase)